MVHGCCKCYTAVKTDSVHPYSPTTVKEPSILFTSQILKATECQTEIRIHRLRFRDKVCGTIMILAHGIHHGLQGFIGKNIEGESTEANDLSHILLEVTLRK